MATLTTVTIGKVEVDPPIFDIEMGNWVLSYNVRQGKKVIPSRERADLETMQLRKAYLEEEFPETFTDFSFHEITIFPKAVVPAEEEEEFASDDSLPEGMHWALDVNNEMTYIG